MIVKCFAHQMNARQMNTHQLYIAGNFTNWVPISMYRSRDKPKLFYYDIETTNDMEMVEFKFLSRSVKNIDFLWEHGNNRKLDKTGMEYIYIFDSKKLIESKQLDVDYDNVLFQKYYGVCVKVYQIPLIDDIKNLKEVAQTVSKLNSLCLYLNDFQIQPNNLYYYFRNTIGNGYLVICLKGIIHNINDEKWLHIKTNFVKQVIIQNKCYSKECRIRITGYEIEYEIYCLVKDIANVGNCLQIGFTGETPIPSHQLYFYQPTIFNLIYSNLPIHLKTNKIIEFPINNSNLLRTEDYLKELQSKHLLAFIFNFSNGTIQEFLYLINNEMICFRGWVTNYKNLATLLLKITSMDLQVNLILAMMKKERFWFPYLLECLATKRVNRGRWINRICKSDAMLLEILCQMLHYEKNVFIIQQYLDVLDLDVSIMLEISELYKTRKTLYKQKQTWINKRHIFSVNLKYQKSVVLLDVLSSKTIGIDEIEIDIPKLITTVSLADTIISPLYLEYYAM